MAHLIDNAPVPPAVKPPRPRRPAGHDSRSGAFATGRLQRRYWVVMAILLAVAALSTAGLLAWNNPMPIGSEGFWLIAGRRATALLVMGIVAISQAAATVAFQTVTNNRIITPSIMGFESLYRAIQTTSVYLFGIAGLVTFTGLGAFALQVGVMVGLTWALYGWLLSRRSANLQVMLLIGIVLGGGLNAVSSFMQRMLTPSEFDVLTARMFGSMANADPAYFPLAIPLVVAAFVVLWRFSPTLNAVALGRHVATNLGINHRRATTLTLIASSVLIAASTALVGPMTFFGFLVATLAYQWAGTADHRHVFALASVTGYAVLTLAYVVMHHVFYAHGVVSIIIELVGGSLFLITIVRRGRL